MPKSRLAALSLAHSPGQTQQGVDLEPKVLDLTFSLHSVIITFLNALSFCIDNSVYILLEISILDSQNDNCSFSFILPRSVSILSLSFISCLVTNQQKSPFYVFFLETFYFSYFGSFFIQKISTPVKIRTKRRVVFFPGNALKKKGLGSFFF